MQAAGCGSPAALSSSSSSTATALWVSAAAQTPTEITYGRVASVKTSVLEIFCKSSKNLQCSSKSKALIV